MRSSSLLALCAGIGALCLWGVASYSLEYPTVVFVIPNDFHGPFVIYEDPGGVEVASSYKTHSIEVPESRVLRLRSTQLLHDWSYRRAERRSGEEVPILDDEFRPRQVALWSGGYSLGSHHPARYEFFVGTEAEFMGFEFSEFEVRTNSTHSGDSEVQ